jgi:hypothetical protein
MGQNYEHKIKYISHIILKCIFRERFFKEKKLYLLERIKNRERLGNHSIYLIVIIKIKKYIIHYFLLIFLLFCVMVNIFVNYCSVLLFM